MATIVIDPDDLAAHPYGAGKPVVLSRTRRNETELPRVVEITYPNVNFDYEKGHETQTRLITEARSHITFELPIVFVPDEAAQVADILMANYWVERVEYELYLPFFKYWRVEPTDILSVTYENATHSIRVNQIEYDLAHTIKVRGVANEQSIYTSKAKGGTTELAAAIVPVQGPTTPFFLNLPPVMGTSDFGGWWFGTTGIFDGWSGASLFESRDEGVSYDFVRSNTVKATSGYTASALASGTTTTWDTYNAINVYIHSGQLSSDTDLNVLNGSNQAYLAGEVIRFAEASLVASSTYRISRLLRGLYGTDWAISSHTAGEELIILDDNIFQVDMADAYRDVDDAYKVVGIGKFIDAVAVTSFTGTSLGLKPYTPVHITGKRNAARDLTIRWKRSDRVNFEWKDYQDNPISEYPEIYEIDIYNSAGTGVVRTIASVSSQAKIYPASTQVTDLGSTNETITVEIFQISATIGRGYGRKVTI